MFHEMIRIEGCRDRGEVGVLVLVGGGVCCGGLVYATVVRGVVVQATVFARAIGWCVC